MYTDRYRKKRIQAFFLLILLKKANTTKKIYSRYLMALNMTLSLTLISVYYI
jgi:hypothetical protein